MAAIGVIVVVMPRSEMTIYHEDLCMWKSPEPFADPIQTAFCSQIGYRAATNLASFPNLRTDDDVLIAADYSGEHQSSNYQVLSFLLADRPGVLASWDSIRRDIRNRYLSDGRKHEFKKLADSQRQKALGPFLNASSQINGLLFSVALDKRLKDSTLGFGYVDVPWTKPAVLAKMIRIAFFGSNLLAGLTREGQTIKWLTDNDEIVSNPHTQSVFSFVISTMLKHSCRFAFSEVTTGIAGEFDDDFRAEDLCSIADLAGGAMSDLINSIPTEEIPKSACLYTPIKIRQSMKSTILTAWFSDMSVPLKKLFCLVRPDRDDAIRFSIGCPEVSVGNSYPGQIWLPPDQGWKRNWRSE